MSLSERPLTDAELKDREIERLRVEANERFRIQKNGPYPVMDFGGGGPFIPNPILQPFERDVLVTLISALRGRPLNRSREQSLVLTKLEEALHWADAPVNVPQEGGR